MAHVLVPSPAEWEEISTARKAMNAAQQAWGLGRIQHSPGHRGLGGSFVLTCAMSKVLCTKCPFVSLPLPACWIPLVLEWTRQTDCTGCQVQSICRAWLHEAACSKQVVGKIVATIACRGYMDVWMPDALMLLTAFPSACVSLTDVEVADDLTTLIDTANAPIFGINVHGRASHLDCCS